MDTNNWHLVYFDFHSITPDNTGTPTVTGDGLNFIGKYNRGNAFLSSNSSYDLRDTTVFMKWQVNTTQYLNTNGVDFLDRDASGGTGDAVIGTNFTTYSSSLGSTVIQSGTWYYTRYNTSGNTFFSYTATGGYDTQGGTLITPSNGNPQSLNTSQQSWLANAYIAPWFGDNYQTNASMTVAEVIIESQNGPSVPEPSGVLGTSIAVALGAFSTRKKSK